MTINLLFVEDSEHKKNAITDFIDSQDLDINLTFAASFSSASKKIDHSNYDIVLLDLSLPTYDKSDIEPGGRFRTFGGREIARKLLRKKLFTKIIFITQYVSFSDNNKFYTFESLKSELKNEFSVMFAGMIHYHSAKSAWKDELIKCIKDAFVANTNS